MNLLFIYSKVTHFCVVLSLRQPWNCYRVLLPVRSSEFPEEDLSSHAAVKDSICHNKRKKRMLYAENKTQSCQINKYIFLKNQALQAAALIVNSPPSPVMPSYTLKNSSGLTMGMEEASRGG